ncbi:UNVERIFIED_CONTAM: hypothetical protein FKN15_021211 [Acipenser sinensis]
MGQNSRSNTEVFIRNTILQKSIGRTLIPRYFSTVFEGGVTDLYYILKHSKESFQNSSITVDCDQCTMVTQHGKPMFTKVCTEGRLILEFTFDDLMRIKAWHFTIRQYRELVPRSILAMHVCTEGRLILEFTFDDLMRIKAWHFTIRQYRELVPRSILAMHGFMAGGTFHAEGVAKLLTEDIPSGPESELDYDEEDIEDREWLTGSPSHIDSEMSDQDTVEDEAGHEEREDSGEEADSDKIANSRQEEESCTEIVEECGKVVNSVQVQVIKEQTENCNPCEKAVDETMVKFKGRSSFKQYLSMKPVKRGYKIWTRADMNGYVCDFSVYTGKTGGNPERDLGGKVVKSLCSQLEGKACQIYFDNYFTSVLLLQDMKAKGLHCCGTVRANRKHLPTLKSEKELKRGDSDFTVSSDGISCVRWKDKRTVTLLSTIHSPISISQVERKEEHGSVVQLPCPKMIKDYNKSMGCVDKADMMKSFHAIDRKSKKWWHRLLWHYVDVTIVSLHILFKELFKTNKMKLKAFGCSVVTGLVGTYAGRSSSDGRRSDEGRRGSGEGRNGQDQVLQHKPYIPLELCSAQALHLPVHST